MADIGSLMIKLGVDTSGVLSAQVAVQQLASTAGASAAKANAAMAMFSKETIRNINTVSQRLRTFGYLATITLTAPIVAFTKSSVEMAKKFEFSMAKIQGLAGIPADMTRQWSEELLKMSASTSIGPEKLAEALYFVASSGFKTAEALDITKMAAQGAATGMGEAQDIADMLVSAMNAYKTSNLTASQAMDIFTAAVREGKIEANRFVTTIGSVLPIASEVGVSLDQVTAAMAAMSLSGATAANSATYLRNVLQKIADPSAEVEKSLNKMGTSGEALRASLRERGLLPTLEELRRLTEVWGETMFDIFPNIRALIGALNLTGQNLEYNRKIFDLIKNSTGDFAKAFEVASQTLQYKWNTALASGRVALIKLGSSIGQVLLPIFERLIKRLQEITDWYTNLHDTQKRLVIGIAAFIAVLGPAALAISVLGYVISGLMTFINGLIGAFELLGAGLMTIPYIAVAAGIIAITASIVKAVRRSHEWERIQSRVNEQINKEIIGLDQAFTRLKATNEGTEARAQAIQGINNQYGEYLQNMLTEKSTLEEITAAQQQLTNVLVARAATEAMQIEKGKLIGDLAQAQTKYLNDYITGYREYIKVAGKSPLKAPEMSADFVKELNGMMDEMGKIIKGDILSKEAVEIGLLPRLVVTNGQIVGITKALDEFVSQQEFEKYAISVGVDVGPILQKYGGLNATISEYMHTTSKEIQPVIDLLAEIESRGTGAGYAIENVRGFYDKWIKDIAAKTGDAKYSFTNFTDAVYAYFKEKQRIDPMLQTLQDSIDTYTSMAITVDEVTTAVEKMYTKIENPILKKIIKEMEEEEDALNRQEASYKRLGISSDVAKKKQQLYLDTLEKIGQQVDFSTAGDYMKIIYQRLKDLGEVSKESGIEIVTLAEMMTDFAGKSEAIKYMAANARRLGIEFDYADSMAKLLTDTLRQVIENKGSNTDFAKKLSESLQNLHPEIYEAGKLVTDLRDKLAEISIQGNFGFPGFSVPEENQKAIEDTLQKLIAIRVAAKNLEGVFLPLGKSLQAPFVNLIPFADILDAKIAELVSRYKDWAAAAEIEDLRRSVEVAKSQAEAYGSLNNQLDVVSKEIQYTERRIHALSTNMEANKQIIIDLSKALDLLKIKYLNIQAASDIGYYQMLTTAFGKYADQMDLVGAQISYVEERLRVLSDATVKDAAWVKDVEGWMDLLYQLRKEQEKFTAFEDSINSLASVFNNLGDAIGGTEGEMLKMFGMILNALPDIIDLVLKYGKAANTSAVLINTQTIATENAAIAKQMEANATLQNISAKAADTAQSTANAAASGASAAAAYTNAGAKSVEANATVVAQGAKQPFPANLVAIALGVAAVIAGLAAAIPKPKKMATGGEVPQGFPNDTFPALLTSGEIVVPPSKAEQFARQILKDKVREKPFAKRIPEMQNGGIVPAGYPNDSFAAMLSSGEAVLPLNELEDVLKRYPAVFKIVDQRTTDSITGQPVSPYSKLHGTLDLSFVEEVVRKALQRGIDPYTALAIPHVETGGTPSGSANPYSVNYESPAQLEKLIADPIGASLDILQAKLKLANKLGYDSYAKMVQMYNGMGRLTQGAVGGAKAYGVQIPEEGISMKENPLYGKRVEDVRNNILMQNAELVSFVESLVKQYGQPTLPSALFKMPEPTPPEYVQPIATETALSVDMATEALKNFNAQLGILNPTLATATDATTESTTALGKYGSLTAGTAQGIGNVVSTAMQGGDVGKAAVSSIGSLLPSLLSLIPGVGPILQLLLGGLGGGLFSGLAAKMATGGIVPMGYPNDTYPALLTSGETVLPKEYRDMPDMLAHLTKQGSIPSGSISDELQLLLSTYEINFPEEKFKSLFAPLMKRPTIPAEQSLNTRKKYITKISNVNNYTNNLTKITKDQAAKNSALTKQLGKITNQVPERMFKQISALSKIKRENAFTLPNTRNVKIKDRSADQFSQIARILKESKGKANVGRIANTGIGNSQVLEKLTKLRRIDDKSLAYLTRISRGTEMTEKLLASADYYPQIARMAGGGQVPSGYPNDSFPAMLSSGEYVLPKNVQRNMRNIEQKPQKIHITLDGKIRGADIGLLLRRINQYQ
jgi:TP901 family phage tail tape measure protein